MVFLSYKILDWGDGCTAWSLNYGWEMCPGLEYQTSFLCKL